jgi:hypothetical protein
VQGSTVTIDGLALSVVEAIYLREEGPAGNRNIWTLLLTCAALSFFLIPL